MIIILPSCFTPLAGGGREQQVKSLLLLLRIRHVTIIILLLIISLPLSLCLDSPGGDDWKISQWSDSFYYCCRHVCTSQNQFCPRHVQPSGKKLLRNPVTILNRLKNYALTKFLFLLFANGDIPMVFIF